MVYSIFIFTGIPFLGVFVLVFIPLVIVAFIPRHIYIVRTLVRNKRADKKRSAPTEPAALAEAQGA